jgi:hypothetical protein
MRRSESPEVVAKIIRGRPFAHGNPGRKPGTKNWTSKLAAALEGEAEELLRSAIAVAKSGDATMLKFLLGRVLPKERTVHVDLPATDGDFDAVDAMAPCRHFRADSTERSFGACKRRRGLCSHHRQR